MSVLPPGQFVYGYYTQAAIISTAVIFSSIGFALVCVRFWLRLVYRKSYIGADDWLILAGSILVIGMAANEILATYVGELGLDGQLIDSDRSVTQSKIDYSNVVFEKLAYAAIKLSVLFFYRRIFTVKRFRIVNNWLIALIVVWAAAFCAADAFVCGVHPEAQWDPIAKKKYHCINVFYVLLVFAVTDVVTDIAILVTPYPQIKKLHVTKREKWGLAGVFLLGALDLLIGIVRLGFIVGTQTIPAVSTDFNPPENTAPTFWTVIELCIGVIAANLPALAPLFRDWLAKPGSMVSSMRRKIAHRSHGSSSDGTAMTHLPRNGTFATISDEGTRIGSFDAATYHDQLRPEKHKSHNVAIFDQFDRIDRMEAGREEEEECPERKASGEKPAHFV